MSTPTLVRRLENLADWLAEGDWYSGFIETAKLGADRIAELERQNAELVKAAQDVIERWDSPKWKFLEPTGSFINKLREAVAAATHPERGEK